MLNLHTHFQGDTIDELTSLVEATERAAFTTNSGDGSTSTQSEVGSPTATQRQPSPEQSFSKKFGCHGANQAHDAGVETFAGQFGGEEQ